MALILRHSTAEQSFEWPEEVKTRWMEEGWAVKDDFKPDVTKWEGCQMTEEEKREKDEANQEEFDKKSEEEESGEDE